jgi:iduronate 2-sulfatase
MQRCSQHPLPKIVLSIVAGMLTAGTLFAKGAGGKPNVLFIAIDDLRPELGCYGAGHIQSPNIDRLASQGVLFRRAYCQAPHCGPSRASLLSGIHTRNHDGIPMNPAQLAPGKPTLPATFRRYGYHTVGNGKIYHQREDDADQSWSEPPFSLVNGPEENNHLTFHDKDSASYVGGKKNRGPFFEAADVPDNTYIDGQTCEKTIRDMRRLAKMERPFFLACGFVRPHLPFYAPKRYWDLYDREKIVLADNRYKPKNAPGSLRGSGEVHSYHDRDITYNSTGFHKIARHGYYACVSYADALVGKLVATLDELDLRENTIVVVWGDHGWHLGEHNFWGKHNLLHNSTHAPLIICAPGFKKGVRTDGIVELLDLYPTLCELAGIDPPEHLEGKSMVPLLRDPGLPGKKAAYTKWRDGRVVTTRDFTYTEYRNNQRMLYDLGKDPDENVNVAADPGYAATIKKLKQLLRQEKGMTYNFREGDKTHFNQKGAEVITDLIIRELKATVPKLAESLN